MSSTGKGEVRSKPAAARVSEGGLRKRFRAWREQHAYSLLSSLGRFFQRPFATLLTVGVMAVAMALPLGLGLALGNVERLSGSVQESREIGVFLNAEVGAEQAGRIAEQIRQRPDVAALTIKSPEQGLAEFRQLSDLAGALELLKENPLPTVLLVQPTDDGAALAAALQARPEVDLVQHDALWRQRLSAWLAFGRQLMWVIAGLLGLGVLLVVGNTVRLEIGNRRDEIAVLQQLGATDGFIRRPFIYLGAWYGLGAGRTGAWPGGSGGGDVAADRFVADRQLLSHFTLRGPDWRMVVVMLFTATVLGWFGAWLASGHHLRQTRPTDL